MRSAILFCAGSRLARGLPLPFPPLPLLRYTPRLSYIHERG